MKKAITILFGVIVVFALLIVAGKAARKAQSEALQSLKSDVTSVQGIVAVPRAFTRRIEETGALAGNRESVVAAGIGGRVMAILVDVGDYVKSGAPMIRLDDELYRLESERARIAFDKAKMDLDRAEKLFAQNSFSESDLEAMRLGVKGAEVGYQMALKNFHDATIVAPFSGTIAAKYTEVGQMIERSMPAVQLLDNSVLKLTVQVMEEQIGYIDVGAGAMVIVDAVQDTISGKVVSVGSRAVNGSRSFPVEIRIPAAKNIHSGMFARAVIEAGLIPNAILVPRVALVPDAGRTVAFVARNGLAQKITVYSLGTEGDLIAVDGIQSGDTVLTLGNQNLTNDAPIKLTLTSGSNP